MLRIFDVPCFFFFNDTATTEIYTLSLHDALPILSLPAPGKRCSCSRETFAAPCVVGATSPSISIRSEEHTSELQSRLHLVCRLLLEKKKTLHAALSALMTDVATIRRTVLRVPRHV